jgi:predicted porin
MDKKILSAAIIVAMAAPVAALADVTLYGQMHMSVGAVDDSTEGAPFAGEDNMQVRNHASRLGVKGSEDLGGGLKANFMLEYGVDPDSNDPNSDGDDTSGMSRRNQWVGLSGDSWGEVRVGRHDTPLKVVQGSFDQFNDTDADIGTIVLGEERVDNVVAYISPSFSGFTFLGAGISGEATTCEEAGWNGLTAAGCPALAVDPTDPTEVVAASDKTGIADIYSLAGMYSNGGLFASLAYNDYDAIQNSGTIDNLMRLIGTYQIGDFQVGGLYETGEREGDNLDTEAWGLSGKYSFGNVDLKGQYMDGTYEQGTVLGVNNPDEEATQWTLGADYNFSKRTTAYFMYTTLEDEFGAAGGFGDRDYDYTGVGVIHKF